MDQKEQGSEQQARVQALLQRSTLTKVLHVSEQTHTLFLQVEIDGETGVAILTPLGIPEDKADVILRRVEARLQQANDRFHQLTAVMQPDARELLPIKASLIYPATDADVLKYSPTSRLVQYETPELHRRLTRPWINSLPGSNVQWVYNILEGTSEQDAVLYRCDEFLLVRDFKWHDNDVSKMYLLVIPTDRSLKTLRDLGPEHAGLLQRMIDQSVLEIDRVFHVPRTSVRMWFHYLPTCLSIGCAVPAMDVLTAVLTPPGRYYADGWTATLELRDTHPVAKLLQQDAAASDADDQGFELSTDIVY